MFSKLGHSNTFNSHSSPVAEEGTLFEEIKRLKSSLADRGIYSDETVEKLYLSSGRASGLEASGGFLGKKGYRARRCPHFTVA